MFCSSTHEYKLLHGTWLRQDFGEIADKPQLLKKLRALYHGSIKLIDDQIARVIEFVKRKNLLDDTIIVFTTDHGDMMGDHGLLNKGIKHYDKGIRCPLIVYGAGIKEQITDRLTCTLDLFPTFCEWAHAADFNLPPIEGKSFAAICNGLDEKDTWKEVGVAFKDVTTVITDDGWRLTRFADDNRGQNHGHYYGFGRDRSKAYSFCTVTGSTA